MTRSWTFSANKIVCAHIDFQSVGEMTATVYVVSHWLRLNRVSLVHRRHVCMYIICIYMCRHDYLVACVCPFDRKHTSTHSLTYVRGSKTGMDAIFHASCSVLIVVASKELVVHIAWSMQYMLLNDIRNHSSHCIDT